MKTKILVIGVGNMGAALAKGLTYAGDFDVSVHDIHSSRVGELEAHYGAHVVSNPATELANVQSLLLCIKPQDLAVVAPSLKGLVPRDCLVISILAGITLQDVSDALGHSGGVVRAMPNIAATVHAAATAMCANDATTDAQRALAMRIFAAIGEADWTKEAQLDAVTGLSGSGPAYLYMVIEALTDGGVKMGIPRVLAARLATQTVLGAAMLVKESGQHPATLKDQVTTPGGTTIHALHELEDRGLRAMLISAVETATKRAADLRKK